MVFRQQPEAQGFAELRQELRDAGRGELLADVCATWAPHERDPIRAADAWSEAGEAMVVLGETETAIEYLRTVEMLDLPTASALSLLQLAAVVAEPHRSWAVSSTSNSSVAARSRCATPRCARA